MSDHLLLYKILGTIVVPNKYVNCVNWNQPLDIIISLISVTDKLAYSSGRPVTAGFRMFTVFILPSL